MEGKDCHRTNLAYAGKRKFLLLCAGINTLEILLKHEHLRYLQSWHTLSFSASSEGDGRKA